MLLCTPEATLKPVRFRFMLKTVIRNVFIVQVCWEAVPNMWPSSCKCAGRLFQTCGPAAAKLLLPNVLFLHGTAHDLSVGERSRRLGPSETKCISSDKYGGAWPDKDE